MYRKIRQSVVKKVSPVVCFQVNEMEISKTAAERKLREHKGSVVGALTELVQ